MKKFIIIIAAVFLVLVFLALINDYRKCSYVTFAFDDGYIDNLEALPIFEKYGFKASVFIIANLTEFENHSLMSVNDLKMLKEKGWEIDSHGMTHSRLTEKTLKEAEDELWLSKEILLMKGFDAKVFAVPYGDYNEEIINLSKKYYSALRTVDYGYNDLNNDFYHLKSFIVKNSTSLDEIKGWINENEKWTIILMHHIGKEHEYGISLQDLDSLLNYTSSTRVKIRTFSEVLDLKC